MDVVEFEKECIKHNVCQEAIDDFKELRRIKWKKKKNQ